MTIDLSTDTAAILNYLVFLEKDCNGKKKIVVPCLDLMMIAFFP